MRYCLFLFVYGCRIVSLYGQPVLPDTAFLNPAVQLAVARYEQAGNDNEQLYNGIEYGGYDPRMKGNQYLDSSTFQPGIVQAGGHTYSVPMLYDIVRDVLVIQHPAGYRMALQSAKIQSFSLLNHQYVYLTDSTDRGIRAGFYELLYRGPTTLLARRTKIVLTNLAANGTFGEFDLKTTYYLRKKGIYYPVKNKNTLLTVLEDQKKPLVQFARKQKIRFKPTPEAAIIRLTQQYDALNTSL